MTGGSQQRQGSLLITVLMHASFNTFANKVVAPLFPAPLLNDYGLLPEWPCSVRWRSSSSRRPQGRLGFHDERRPQESNPAAVPP